MPQTSAAPSLTDRYAVRPSRVASEYGRLPAEVRSLLRLCDGTRNLAELRNASRMPGDLFDEILLKLRAQGLIEPFQRPMRSDRSRVIAWANHVVEDAFSTDEESFFGSPIDHLLEPEERVTSP